MMQRLTTLITLGVLLSAVPQAEGVILKLTPLKEVLNEKWIFVAKVEKVFPDKPAMILVVDSKLKGDPGFERMPVNLTGDSEAAKDKHTQVVLERIEEGTPVIMMGSKRGKKAVTFCYTNGTWFQIAGEEDEDKIRWSFLHCEPYLRRTFKGTTDEMKQTLIDALEKKKDPPEPNPKEEPGFGPPIKKKSSFDERSTSPLVLWGVIQLPGLALIAALAALFPTVFGGLAFFMKRWVAALSVSGFISLWYFGQSYLPVQFIGEWAMSPKGTWFIVAILAAVGATWAMRRYRRSVIQSQAENMQPQKWDRIIFVAFTVLAFGTLCYNWLFLHEALLQVPWFDLLIFSVPIWGTTIFLLWAFVSGKGTTVPVNTSGETILLWAMCIAAMAGGAFEAGRSGGKGFNIEKGTLVASEEIPASRMPTFRDTPLWTFEPAEPAAAISSPFIHKDKIYVSVFHKIGLTGQFGRVYCLDAKSGKELWRFDDDEGMLPVFCSPIVGDGKVFIGEGFHENKNCRVFCLDAENGKPVWKKPFQTSSHTESTPCYSNGRVYFGAGDDGLYCVNAESGEQDWHYTGSSERGEKGVHIDGNPVVVGGRVFVGSGLSRTHQVNRFFCLDARTGKEIWTERVEYSAYGSPEVIDGQVFFGIGNGNFSVDRAPIAGMVLCRDAATGKEIWDCLLPNSVLTKPLVDRRFVYVGCRDGNCYALNRRTGRIAWKSESNSPVVASIASNTNPASLQTDVIYAVSILGYIHALNPGTGDFFWRFPLLDPSRPTSMVTATPAVQASREGSLEHRKLYISVIMSRGTDAGIARLYAFADETDHAAE